MTDFDTFMACAIATSWCQHLCSWQHYLMLQESGCGGTGGSWMDGITTPLPAFLLLTDKIWWLGQSNRSKPLLLHRQSPSGFKLHPQAVEQKLVQMSPLH